MMPTNSVEGTECVSRSAVKRAVLARLIQALEHERASLSDARTEARDHYDLARQPDRFDSHNGDSMYHRTVSDITEEIAKLEEAKKQALDLKLQSDEVVSHGSVVELIFGDKREAELYFIFGDDGLLIDDICLKNRIPIRQVSKGCALAIALFSHRAGEEISFRPNGGETIRAVINQIF